MYKQPSLYTFMSSWHCFSKTLVYDKLQALSYSLSHLYIRPLPATMETTSPASTTPDANIKPVRGGPEFWRKTFSYMTGMGMTDDERAQFQVERHRKKADAECTKCEKNLDYLLNYSYSPFPGLASSAVTVSTRSHSPLHARKYQPGERQA